jgi:hypothetical protein
MSSPNTQFTFGEAEVSTTLKKERKRWNINKEPMMI